MRPWTRDPSRLPLTLLVLAIVGVTHRVAVQGFNLLDDGLWLLGARIAASGGALYRDLAAVYGPAKFYLLAPFLAVFGASVRTLAVFLAGSAALAAVLGYVGARRQGAGRFAWLLPITVLALGPVPPRYVAAAAFALAVTELAAAGRRRALAWVLGVGWGLLALFGLDMFLWGGS